MKTEKEIRDIIEVLEKVSEGIIDDRVKTRQDIIKFLKFILGDKEDKKIK